MVDWLNLDQLAEYLQTPKSTLYKLSQQGDLPGYKVGRRWLFDPAEIDKYIKSQREQPKKRKRSNNAVKKRKIAKRTT